MVFCKNNMDVYEISNLLYNNKLDNCVLDISVNNNDLKTYFEMCVLLTVEGFKHFFRDSNNIVDIEKLSLEDFSKINSYLNKLNINMNLKIYTNDEFNKNNIMNFDEIKINSSTQLNDFNFIIKKKNIYVVNYNYKIFI